MTSRCISGFLYYSFSHLQVVAIGDNWVAIATDKCFIRMYSVGGIQREIISFPGQVITMNGCDSHLGVVYQETEGMINHHNYFVRTCVCLCV